jgi:hypothetical protein
MIEKISALGGIRNPKLSQTTPKSFYESLRNIKKDLRTFDTKKEYDVRIADGSVVRRLSEEDFQRFLKKHKLGWDKSLYVEVQKGVKDKTLINYYRARKYIDLGFTRSINASLKNKYLQETWNE